MKQVKLYLNYAGYCMAGENHAIRGGVSRKIKFHALWGLIRHPEKGWILYDTGYTQRFYAATRKFPNRLYAMATQVFIDPQEEVKAQLERHGLLPEAIKHVIITHFHADHVAGLRDFPNATYYTSEKALLHTLQLSKNIAFTKGVLKALLPEDLEKRTFIIEKNCPEIPDEHFACKYDLFQDGAIYVYHLPGHAAGQIGIMVQTGKRTYFLVADACWLKRSYRENILPGTLARVLFHSWKDYTITLKKLHDFHLDHPEVVIVPTHCSETTDQLIQKDFQLDVL